MSAGLSSGWETYYGVVFAALLSLGLPLGLNLLARILSSRAHARSPGRASEGSHSRGALPAFGRLDVGARPERESPFSGQRLNTRFFLAALLSLLFISAALLLIPCVIVLGSEKAAHEGLQTLKAVTAIVSFAGTSSLAVLYANRKGDLGWLRTFQVKQPLGHDQGPGNRGGAA